MWAWKMELGDGRLHIEQTPLKLPGAGDLGRDELKVTGCWTWRPGR